MSADLIAKIVHREGATLPAGYTDWGIKSVRPDLKTYGGYQWPLPGQVAEAAAVQMSNRGPCPSRPGDGLCVATTWSAMASGGFPARTLLLVATSPEFLVGGNVKRSRHRRVAVVAMVDGERLLSEAGAGADLRYANLQCADLRYANLRAADLQCANLRGATLSGADLRDANLSGADLWRADLRYANLWRADLRAADLQGADLRYANLQGANLQGANLRDANLQGANLRYANLRYAIGYTAEATP